MYRRERGARAHARARFSLRVPRRSSFTVCRCTRVCGCAARRLMHSALPSTYCCVVLLARRERRRVSSRVTRARSPRAIRAEFSLFGVCRKTEFFSLSVATKRPRDSSRDTKRSGGRLAASRLCVSSCAQPRTAMNRSETSRVESELRKTPVKRTKGMSSCRKWHSHQIS